MTGLRSVRDDTDERSGDGVITVHPVPALPRKQGIEGWHFYLSISETDKLSRDVSRIYRSIDRKTDRLQRATSLYCPEGCGTCCKTTNIEATLLETLPLAEAIFNREEEASVLRAIEERISRDDFSCVLFGRPAAPPNGWCGYYPFRPLLCRLFGFAARKNRCDELDFCTCGRLKETAPDGVRRAELSISMGLRIPVYQESFMRIAAMNPAIGFKRYPINLAIKEALEYLYWRRPRRVRMSKAS